MISQQERYDLVSQLLKAVYQYGHVKQCHVCQNDKTLLGDYGATIRLCLDTLIEIYKQA